MRNIIAKVAVSLLIGGIALFASTPAGAWQVPGDFITGGGWFIMQNPYYPGIPVAVPGGRANFGWHGGVKNGDWWGNGNYIDHGSGFHIQSNQVTGYVVVVDYAPDKNGHPRGTRDICGIARVAGFGDFKYRVRMRDLGEPGRNDAFGITLYDSSSGNPVYFAQGVPINGGNIQLHKGNPSTTPPSTPPSCDSPPYDNILFTFQ